MNQRISVWIVCEQTGRWAAAIGAAFLRAAEPKFSPRLYESRNLRELESAIQQQQASVTLVEVRRDNLPQVLDLLSSEAFHSTTYTVGLMDYSAWQSDESPHIKSVERKRQTADILREAGAKQVIDSPRRLRGLLQLQESLASRCACAYPADKQSIEDWVRSILPWQDE